MTEPRRPPSPESQRAGYEVTDVNSYALAIFALGLIVTIVISMALMAALFWQFEAIAKREDPALSPLAGEIVVPKPHLETEHGTELVKYLQAEHKRLENYAWVDRHDKIVRIPIERAIELLVERGIPAPTGLAVTAPGPTGPAETGPAVAGPKDQAAKPEAKPDSIKEPAEVPAKDPNKEPSKKAAP